jgi:thiamine biosynthesis lipoprotein
VWRAALAWGAALLLAACQKAPSPHVDQAYVFGTLVEISITGTSPETAKAASKAVLDEFYRLHNAYHAWQPSELSQLNAAIAAGRADIPVSAELAHILDETQRWSKLADGLFDPAIGGVVALWGFHADGREVVPAPADITRWRNSRPRVRDLSLRDGRVSSANRAVQLDLGGYLKGYALDRAAAILRDAGIRNALINIGGHVMALGNKNGEPWLVGLQHPRRAGLIASVELHDGEALGTSGDYQRYFIAGGQRHHHLIDPNTGEPARHHQMVSVIAGGDNAGVRSDVASKPLFIGDPANFDPLAQRLGVAALRVDANAALHFSQGAAGRFELVEER